MIYQALRVKNQVKLLILEIFALIRHYQHEVVDISAGRSCDKECVGAFKGFV